MGQLAITRFVEPEFACGLNAILKQSRRCGSKRPVAHIKGKKLVFLDEFRREEAEGFRGEFDARK
tara:strand:+ start:2093 stop:2287 length:195 start_codon:yes stop_codon:yes gene_type:complete